jgi:DnaJ-class molecular chaperone
MSALLEPHFDLPSVGEPCEFIETTKVCPECQGEGRVEYESVTLRFFDPFQSSVETCQRCYGAGEVPVAVCTGCGAEYDDCKCDDRITNR